MKTCKTPHCKKVIEDKFQYCREHAALNVKKFKSRWRRNNPDYNKIYLRKWKRDLKLKDAELRKKFIENPIPFLLEKAKKESEYLELLRAGGV